MPGLSISDLVKVDLTLQPTLSPSQNFGALLLVSTSDAIDTAERIRRYSSLDGVAADHGTSSDTYKAAALFYGQSPQPDTLFVGRWLQSASKGLLYGGKLTTAQQALTNFTAVSDGAMKITVDGTVKTLSAIDLSSETNLNGVASVLTTALAGAVVAFDAANARFVVTSPTTGTASKIGFASAGDSGTDLSLLMNLTDATDARTIDGLAGETLASAVQLLASKSNDFYGVAIAVPSVPDSDILAVAEYVEGANPQRFFVATTQDASTLDATSTTDLASQLAALKYNRTGVQYSTSSPFAGVSLFARQASVDFNAQNSVISLMYKQEPGISPELVSETQAQVLRDKHCNVFVQYSNNSALIQFGQVASGLYIDSVVGAAYLQNGCQLDAFNLLYTSPTKLSQTDAGVNQIVAALEARLDQAVENGLLAPGVWTGGNTGPLKTGQVLSKGYFIYAPPVASQPAADRSARKSPAIQIAAKLSGAIHEVDVQIAVAS
jgi:hypothetical protein